jgi:Tol biopolymer transport system component
MTRRLLLWSVALVALVLVASSTLAGKGGGKPPKDPPPGEDFTVSFVGAKISGKACLATPTGDTFEAVTSFPVWWGATWMPDGNRLLTVAEVDGPGIYTIDLATGQRTKLLAVLNYGASPDASVASTPNGNQMLVYTDNVNGGGALFVANPDGSGKTQLTPSEANRLYWHPRFHPSGSGIGVMTKLAGVPWNVVLLDLGLDGSGELVVTGTSQLTNVAGSPLAGVSVGKLEFANAGDKAVVGSEQDIWLIDLSDPANPTNLTQGAVIGAGAPCFDATDEKIYFYGRVVRRKGQELDTVFRMNVDGTGIEQALSRRQNSFYPQCKKP